jgi:hypothetical protein
MLKLDKVKKVISDEEAIDGLFTCTYDYEIKDTKARLRWQGPPISPEVWYPITTFFKWTYDKYKSESQVRLFVNVKEKIWAAWAFPQEANTGVSARELDQRTNEAAQEQRKQFGDGWELFGTVHHHCSMQAFQSNTDEQNEKDQDGLHITIGKLDEKQYDMDARFYRNGLKFTPDMTWFWDVGDVKERCPEAFRQYLPADLAQKTAIREMTTPMVCEFPEIWKENIIEIPKKEYKVEYIKHEHGNGHSRHHMDTDPVYQRVRSAWGEIKADWKMYQLSREEMEDVIDCLTSPEGEVFLKHCVRHRVELSDMTREIGLDMDNDLATGLDEKETAPVPLQKIPLTEAEIEQIQRDYHCGM